MQFTRSDSEAIMTLAAQISRETFKAATGRYPRREDEDGWSPEADKFVTELAVYLAALEDIGERSAAGLGETEVPA